MRTLHRDAHMLSRPDECPKSPRVHPADSSPVPRDFTLVVEVDPPVILERSGRKVPIGDDRCVDRPGTQNVAGLEHEVPVDSVPDMLEQDKTRHLNPTMQAAKTGYVQ